MWQAHNYGYLALNQGLRIERQPVKQWQFSVIKYKINDLVSFFSPSDQQMSMSGLKVFLSAGIINPIL